MSKRLESEGSLLKARLERLDDPLLKDHVEDKYGKRCEEGRRTQQAPLERSAPQQVAQENLDRRQGTGYDPRVEDQVPVRGESEDTGGEEFRPKERGQNPDHDRGLTRAVESGSLYQFPRETP